MKVAAIGQVFVKATQFLAPDAVEVDADGIRHDRLFALVEANDAFVNSDQHRLFMQLRFDYDAGRVWRGRMAVAWKVRRWRALGASASITTGCA